MSFFNGRKRNIGTCVATEVKTEINETLILKYNNTIIRKNKWKINY
jgi:hypothetical protein